MKKNIHPVNNFVKVICSCGNSMLVLSTLKKSFSVDVCYKCHSFYTGKQKFFNNKGRIDKFKKRFGDMFFNK